MKMQKKRFLSSFLFAVVLLGLLAVKTFAQERVITVDDDGPADHASIQAAIDAITAMDDPTGWTIQVKNGTYDRFTVPYAADGLTIVGESESGVIVNVLYESVSDALVDNGGINSYGDDVVLKNMTLIAGTSKTSWDDAAISTSNGKSGGSGVSLTVENCTLVGPGIGNGASYGIFWACDRVEVTGCHISGFSNAIEFMNDGFRVPAGETYSISGNVITGASFAVHGYMGGGSGDGILEISGNTITGTQELRSKVIAQDNTADSFAVNIHDNALQYALVGLVNLQDAGDVVSDVFASNELGEGCFYVEAVEPGTIHFYTTYYAPQGGSGYWALTGIDDFDVDWGKNPDGSTAYIQQIIDRANAEGSRELSVTGIDENNLIKTFTWFKDGIYWVSVKEPASCPDLEKWIVSGTGGKKNLAESGSAAAGDTVAFELHSSVPEDPDYSLVFHDEMASGLILDESSIALTVNGREADPSLYTVRTGDSVGDGCAFELEADLAALYAKGYFTDAELGMAPIAVTYTATACEALAAGAYPNTAWTAYAGSQSPKDTVNVTATDPEPPVNGSPDTGETGRMGLELAVMLVSVTAVALFLADKDRRKNEHTGR